MQTKKTKLVLGFAALLVIAIGTIGLAKATPFLGARVQQLKLAAIEPGFYKVTDISDGDTISVNMDGRIEKVRMIGVDTPETKKPNSPVECFGQAASDYTKKVLTDQTVRLVADPINQNRDRYNRLLRYVYLQDGSLYNAELIKRGYGFAYLSFPFTKAEEFRQYQTAARTQSIGLWAGECEITDLGGRLKANGIE